MYWFSICPGFGRNIADTVTAIEDRQKYDTYLISTEDTESEHGTTLVARIKEDGKDPVIYYGDEAEKLARLFGIEKAVIDWIAFR